MYRLLIFLHIVAAFLFFAAHGVSVWVSFALRKETDRARVRSLLELSGSSIGFLYISLMVILGTGVWGGFIANWWSKGWIWTSLAILIVTTGLMYPLGSNFYNRVREAAGSQTYQQMRKGTEAPPESSDEELQALLQSGRPHMLAGVGGLAFLAIVWLMYFKPF